jgi:hypothetical protein
LAILQKLCLERVGEYSDKYESTRVKNELAAFGTALRGLITDRLRIAPLASRSLASSVNSAITPHGDSSSATPGRGGGGKRQPDESGKEISHHSKRSRQEGDVDKPFKCNLCVHDGYKNKKSLDNHILVKHNQAGIVRRYFAFN